LRMEEVPASYAAANAARRAYGIDPTQAEYDFTAFWWVLPGAVMDSSKLQGQPYYANQGVIDFEK
ncbi:hypothetical protein BX616_000353, partial [Lobosporangium transversale]